MAQLRSPDEHHVVTRIPRSLHRAVRLAAFEAEVTLNAWVAEALETHLRRKQAPGGDQDAPASA